MKYSEMNRHQKKMYFLIDEIMGDTISGFANSLEEYKPDAAEYKKAEAFFNKEHDELAAYFYNEVMKLCKVISYANCACYAGGDFIKESINERLHLYGY